MADLKDLKGVAEKDRQMIADAEKLLGPEPSKMGFIKNVFWGRFREELIFPYPQVSADENAKCEKLLAALDKYMREEHPSVSIDQDQEIPRWVIDRLFELGVLGMTIPVEFGGLGLGITSYNRVLQRIGASCCSTAVMVSAHQSIGCKAIMLFGTDEQKSRWLPHLAKDWLSAFCLSEPQVGCDAGGQETRCTVSEDGEFFILNGEKKWATSAALSGLFTVMCKQQVTDPKSGKTEEKVTALVCTPDMEGIDIFQKNRSKCGIRGTWQARIRFKDVRVPKSHLLHKEGKGLNVALTCLNYGRCTLSAGMLGGAVTAFEQGTKWGQTRYQFQRPLADFELVQAKIANMASLCYAMDAMLYMTTGMLDRHDDDIMVETALCKVFCSEMGWRVVNDAMQIMGGEGYMTENELERIFRDSRINLIVEGANEVMQSFIFAYGGKQYAERLLGLQQIMGWDNSKGTLANMGTAFVKVVKQPKFTWPAQRIAFELYGCVKRSAPAIRNVHASLSREAKTLAKLVRNHSNQFLRASANFGEKIITRQMVQARLADSALWIHGYACTLSKLDSQIRRNDSGPRFERDKAAALHFMAMAATEIKNSWRSLWKNNDTTSLNAAKAAMKFSETLPNSDFVVHESSPSSKGTGRRLKQDGIKQFPGDSRTNAVKEESRDFAEQNR